MDYTYLDTPCVDDRGQPLLSVQDNSMSLYDASSIGVQLALVFFVPAHPYPFSKVAYVGSPEDTAIIYQARGEHLMLCPQSDFGS